MTPVRIYIAAAEQISIQQPLCEDWMHNPMLHTEPRCVSIDPDFREILSPIEARRMGKILKRALFTSLKAIRKSGVGQPEAIITGTGLGCIENTELFLQALCRDGEEFLKPTHFMQSTHNTIGSLIGIHTRSHGYNATYAHAGISFESALYDAWLQMRLRKAATALVGGFDEMTPDYFALLRRTGYVGQEGQVPCGEAAVSFMLTVRRDNCLCELAGVALLHRPDVSALCAAAEALLARAGMSGVKPDAILIGVNGSPENDNPYAESSSVFFPRVPRLRYKHLFGESYTASGLGMYVAYCCLAHGMIPSALRCDETTVPASPRHLLLLNHSGGKDYSLILLKAVCGK